jgi:hypothetical protein
MGTHNTIPLTEEVEFFTIFCGDVVVVHDPHLSDHVYLCLRIQEKG